MAASQFGETVAVFGDSLGKGVIWNPQRSRYGYAPITAANVVEQELGITVLNRARFGYTAPQGLQVMEQDLASGMRCDAAVIEFGGNDCNFKWAEISQDPEARHDPATSPETYEKTLVSMVRQLLEQKIRPILLTLPPINAERYFRFLVGDKLDGANILRWLGDVHQIYRFQEMYSEIVSKVGRKLSVTMLDLRTRCLAKPDFTTRLLCDDGLHLTVEGQKFVGEQLADMVLCGEE